MRLRSGPAGGGREDLGGEGMGWVRRGGPGFILPGGWGGRRADPGDQGKPEETPGGDAVWPPEPSPREDGALSARGRASPGPAPWPLGVGPGSFP